MVDGYAEKFHHSASLTFKTEWGVSQGRRKHSASFKAKVTLVSIIGRGIEMPRIHCPEQPSSSSKKLEEYAPGYHVVLDSGPVVAAGATPGHCETWWAHQS